MSLLLLRVLRALRLISRKRYREKSIYARIRMSGLFNARWYVRHADGSRKSKKNPLRHYLNHGWHMGFNPSPCFSTRKYLSDYPDVAASGVCPLVHYIKHGRREGRMIRTVYPNRNCRPSGFWGRVRYIATYPVRVHRTHVHLENIYNSLKSEN